MATFFRPEAPTRPPRIPVLKRETSVDQVLIRLLLHLGAGLQVGKPVH